MPNKVLTVREAADMLRVHQSTIYRLLKRRELPAFKIGSDWRFNQEHLYEWLNERGRQTQIQSASAPRPSEGGTDSGSAEADGRGRA